MSSVPLALILFACGTTAGKGADRSSVPPTALGGDTETADTGEPQSVSVSASIRPVGHDIRLAYWLDVSADAPVSVSATWSDGVVEGWVSSDEAALSHSLLLVGLRADRAVTVAVVVADEADAELDPLSLDLYTDTLPEVFPLFDVVAHDPDRTEPGYLLFPLYSGAYAYLVALDEELEVVWFQEKRWTDVRIHRGNLFGITDKDVVEMTFAGDEVRRYSQDAYTGGPSTPMDLGGDVHHEVFPQPDDSFLVLSHVSHQVDLYPTSYYRPYDSLAGPQMVKSAIATEVAADGSTVRAVDMIDVLDTERISWDGLDGAHNDWVHANALIPHPDGGMIVSLRHQDAVVKVDGDGALEWILADHAGWRGAYRDKLLVPISDPFIWPYHQHAPQWIEDGSEPFGRLLVFDNRNRGATVYSEAPPGEQSAGVIEYLIDENNGAVSMVGRWEDFGSTTPLVADAYGDADLQPQTGNILATFGRVQTEYGGSDDQASVARLIEFHSSDPTDPALDLRLWGDPRMWRSDRCERIAPLRAPAPTE